MPNPTYFSKSFGSYLYDDLRDGLEMLEQDLGYRHRMTKAYSRDEAFADNSLHDPRRLRFTGLLTGAGGRQDAAALRLAWDGFAAAHSAGPVRRLQIDSDRYINARVEALSDKFDGLCHEFQLSFLCFDPFWYAPAMSQVALVPGGTAIITTGGTAYSWPLLTLVVTGAPGGGSVTILNSQDTALSFAPPAPGTYTIDCGQETITDAAGADQFAFMSGDLPLLVAGAGPYGAPNSLTLTASGGAAVSGASVQWQDRWI